MEERKRRKKKFVAFDSVGSYYSPSESSPPTLWLVYRHPLDVTPTTKRESTLVPSATPTLRGARRDVVGEKEKRGGLETPVQKHISFCYL